MKYSVTLPMRTPPTRPHITTPHMRSTYGSENIPVNRSVIAVARENMQPPSMTRMIKNEPIAMRALVTYIPVRSARSSEHCSVSECVRTKNEPTIEQKIPAAARRNGSRKPCCP